MYSSPLHEPNMFTWSAIILANAKLGQEQQIIKLCEKMQQSNVKLGEHLFVAVLSACSSLAALDQGKYFHAHCIENGCESTVFIGNSLIDMYAKCGVIEDARRLFNQLLKRSVVTYNTMITGYVQHGHAQEALQLFEKMQQENMEPSDVTFVCILKAFSVTTTVGHGNFFHDYIIKRGCNLSSYVGNTLVDMYGKCGDLEDARRVFEGLPKQSVVMWNAMIAGYAQNGHGYRAFQLFQQMQDECWKPSNVTFVCILKACSSIAFLKRGKLVHNLVVRNGCESDLFVGNGLIGMYVRCGILDDALTVFDKMPKRDAVTWNTMMAGFVQYGTFQESLQLFLEMQQENMEPNDVTYICMLKGCSSLGVLDQGLKFHALIVKNGFESNVIVGNTLVDMYAKCGGLKDACKVFNQLPKQNLVIWNTMFTGYAQNNHCQEALQLFLQMQQEGMRPNSVTHIVMLKACSGIAALDQGKLVHANIIENDSEVDMVLGNALIDMYAKCGSLEDAREIFEILPQESLEAWNAMLCGYSQRNDYHLALQFFEVMQKKGIKPDDVTFVSLLSACSHLGHVEEGCRHFNSITETYGITPVLDHYSCMVDLFGRAGCLKEASNLLETMPLLSNIISWTSLLSHCLTHGNVEIGKRCFDHIVTLDPQEASGYVLMSIIYANAGMWEAVDRIKELKICALAWKKPGKAVVELDDNVHDFGAGDSTHSQSFDVYAKLKRIKTRMKEEAYVPHLKFMMQPMICL